MIDQRPGDERAVRRLGRLACFMLALAAAPVAEARIRGQVIAVGFPLGQSRYSYRQGAWLPILVDLALEEETSFNGYLHVEQFDRDGDVCYHEVPVNLMADSSPQRRYWLYVPALPREVKPDVFAVQLLDQERKVVEVASGDGMARAILPAEFPMHLGEAEMLILNMSAISDAGVSSLLSDEQAGRFDSEIRLSRIAPNELPDWWPGLEMVDVIVWNDADFSVLSPAQEKALVNWLLQGGTLLIAAGRTADSVRASSLGPHLPVEIGQVATVRELHQTQQYLTSPQETRSLTYDRPVAVARCKLRTAPSGPTADRTLQEDDGLITAVWSRAGSGRLIFVPASLVDLLIPGQSSPVALFTRLLQLRPATDRDTGRSFFKKVDLLTHLESTIAFQQQSGIYFTVGLIFAVGYVLLSTLGSWGYLRRRGLQRHNWSAFGVIVVAASILSVLGVWSIRGFSRRADQFCIVDTTAGSRRATATCYVGLRSPSHVELDVWLPSETSSESEPAPGSCSLKPMPLSEETENVFSSYAATTRYGLRPMSASLENVPIRATLKQFTGRWNGFIEGSIDASLSLENVEGEPRFTPGSFVQNKLSEDITQCFLVQALDEVMRPNFQPNSQRSDSIYVHPLGPIAAGQRFALDRIYLDRKGQPFSRSELRERRQLTKVFKALAESLYSVTGLGRLTMSVPDLGSLRSYEEATLVLSLIGEFDPRQIVTANNWGIEGFEFARPTLRYLDLSAAIGPQRALLLAFTEGGGPMRVSVRAGSGRFDSIAPSKANAVYRVLVPVKQ